MRGTPQATIRSDTPRPLDELVRGMIGRRVRDLRIEVRDGAMVIRGRTDSYHAKQLAQHTAMAVTDLPLAANRIEVIGLHRSWSAEPDGAEETVSDAGPPATVLLATGDDRLRTAGRCYLSEYGYTVVAATDGVECVTRLREAPPDVVVLDDALLWGGAAGVLAHLAASPVGTTPVILLGSGPVRSRAADPTEEPPIVAVLEKPVAVSTLLWAVRSATGPGTTTQSDA